MDSTGHARFDRALGDLDRAGSTVLVVGTVPDEQFGAVTDTLVGDAAAGPRRRLFVTRDETIPAVAGRLPDQPVIPNQQGVRVIAIPDPARSAVAAGSSDAAVLPTTRVDPADIDELAQTILEAIDEFDRLAAGLQPAELRLSVSPLSTLIDAHGTEAVFRMIHVLNHIVEEKEGLAHYHLPVELESGVVRTFRSLFDAVVELRLTGGQLEQRWHLQEPDTRSEWLPVPARA